MKRLLMAALCVLTLAASVTSCSKDESTDEPKVTKTDPALTGVWAKFSPQDKTEIEEAVSFEPDAEILIRCEPFDGYSGGWWAGNYEVTGNGRLVAHVFMARVTKFTWFNDYEAFAADPTTHDWYFTYTINSNVLTLKHESQNKTFVLELVK